MLKASAQIYLVKDRPNHCYSRLLYVVAYNRILLLIMLLDIQILN